MKKTLVLLLSLLIYSANWAQKTEYVQINNLPYYPNTTPNKMPT
ncbi:hypothetical protein [Flavobacterium sp. LM5]|nr:hypothetical protein [Flavobacterium sp. LM5]